MTKVILVRHCQAEGNLKRFFQGRIDAEITATGRAQIGSASETLCAEPIDIMYTTSLSRARQTAEGINVYHDVPLLIEDGFLEINPGEWEGIYLSEIEKRYPEQYDNWKNHPAAFVAPNGESMQQVYDRTSKALMKVVSENKGKTICIVSHGCAIRNMMCFLHGWSIDKIGLLPIGTNTSMNVVTFDDNLNPTVMIENYTDHLQA